MQETQENKKTLKAHEKLFPSPYNEIVIDICPRCHDSNLLDLGVTFDCLNCRLEFNKNDLRYYTLENGLAIEEKSEIVSLLMQFYSEDLSFNIT